MSRDPTQEDFSTSYGDSFFIGLLVGCMTIVLCLIFGYYLVVSLHLSSPTGGGDWIEPGVFLVILAIPIAEAVVFFMQGKRKSAIGVVVSWITIFGLLFMLFACLAGWVCHGSGRW
jgi:hypothetical protein